MSHNSNDRQSKDKEKQETTEEDLDFQLDDFDDEIIDLVDPLEGEGEESDDSSAHDEVVDADRDLSFEDFDVEMELGEDEPSVGSMIEPLEHEEESKTDYSNEIETALGEPFEGDEERQLQEKQTRESQKTTLSPTRLSPNSLPPTKVKLLSC